METECNQNFGKSWLENLLAEKIKKNPQFSLRAFARLVEVNPAVLSRVLTGKRRLTFKLAVRIADALNLEMHEREKLYSTYTHETPNAHNEDSYLALKNWYHYGITQIILLKNFREDYRWIAKTLDISELEARNAVERLIRLKVLARDEDQELIKTNFHFDTTPEIAASGIKIFQKEIFEKAINSLEVDEDNERNISSITLAISEDKLIEAKKEIKNFKKNMTKLLVDGEKTRIYNLSVSLFPLSESILDQKCLNQ